MRQLSCVVFVLSVTGGLLVASSTALAAPVVATDVHGPFDPSTTTDEVFFAADVSNSDLLHGIAGTGGAWNANGSSPDGLNDANPGGDFNAVGNPAALNGAAWAADGDNISFREFDLGLGSGAGYDITEIQSIAAWSGAGFSNQKYDVSVRFVGDALFTALASVDYQPFTGSLTEGGSTKVNVTDTTGTLASGVDVIKFSILDTTSNNAGGAVFREIDVFGAETIPGPPVPPLELIVDRGTGLITMDNIDVDVADQEIDFYQIASAAGALDTLGWNSFSDQNLDPFEDPGGDISGAGNDPGETWDEGGSVSANLLGEAFLLSSSTIEIGTDETLGNGYAGTELADEDLVFQYALGNGALVDGAVTYISEYTGGIDGDYNDNGQVEQGDLDLVLLNWGNSSDPTPPLWTNPDFPPTAPTIDQDDLDGVLLNWGNTAAVAAADVVPEPASAFLLLTGGLLLGRLRRND